MPTLEQHHIERAAHHYMGSRAETRQQLADAFDEQLPAINTFLDTYKFQVKQLYTLDIVRLLLHVLYTACRQQDVALGTVTLEQLRQSAAANQQHTHYYNGQPYEPADQQATGKGLQNMMTGYPLKEIIVFAVLYLEVQPKARNLADHDKNAVIDLMKVCADAIIATTD